MTPNNLPVQLTSFIGRSGEIEELRRTLSTTRMLTLTGSGGCGKTRLAIQVASELGSEYAGGVWLVDLANVRDRDLVPGAFMSALGLQDQMDVEPVQMLIRHLQAARTLIVLDNCEHLIAACAELAESVLRRCSHVSLLATSREPLGLPGETTWRVASLSSPDESVSSAASTLTEYEAVRLFVDRALKARPNFRITDENASAVAQICSRLDGIPLAIELAAARVKVLTARQISDGLTDRFHLLTGGSRVVMPRQQTLQASVDWSYQLLSDNEKVVLDGLSVFAGGFTLDAAEAVCPDDAVGSTDVLDILERLVDKSLVVAEVDDRPTARFRMLETIRQFAMERLVENGRVKQVREQHMHHYFELGAAASLESPPHMQEGVRRELRPEADNFRAAMRWALAGDDAEVIVRLATQLGWLLLSLGQRRELTDLLDRVLDSVGGVPPEALSRAWMLRGWAGIWCEPAALEYGERALRFAEEGGDEQAAQAARVLIAQSALAIRETARLEAIASDLEEHAARGSFEHMFALCIRAANLVNAGQVEHAKSRFEETIALARSSGNMSMLSTGQLHVGYMCLLEGDFDSAGRFAEEAAATDRLLDVPDPRPFEVLGQVDLYRGNAAAAKERFGEALSISRERQMPNFEGVDTALFALAALAEGDMQAASELAEAFESFAGCSEMKLDTRVDAVFFAGLYRVLCLQRDSRELLQKITQTSPRPGEDLVVAIATLQKARNCRDEAALEEADALVSEALPMFRRFGTKPFVVESLELAAGLAADQESFREAARLFAAADAARRELRFVRFGIDQPRYDADLGRIAEALADAFPLVWEEGARMTLGEAVDYALRGRGERKRPTIGWSSLTPAELKVSALVAEGLSNPMIAERLFISRHTVETHLKNTFVKLGISSRAQLAGEAVRRNHATKAPAAEASNRP